MRFFMIIVAFLLVPGAVHAQQRPSCQDNLVDEGSFEGVTVSSGRHQNFTSVGRWRPAPNPAAPADEIEIQNNASGGVAIHGSNYLEVASNDPAWVTQTVPTVAGAQYALAFAYKPRPNYGSEVEVWWSNNRVLALPPSRDANSEWRYFTVSVVGTGNDRITFRDISIRDSGGGLIDDVILCRKAVAKGCCCGSNSLWTSDKYPHLNWVLKKNGNFARVWWDQGDHQEELSPLHLDEQVVSGSLGQDPFGDGVVALTSAGNIIRSVEANGSWTTELILPTTVQRYGGVRPCMLASTTEGPFKGIWAVAGNFLIRFYLDTSGAWRHTRIDIKDNASMIVPSSLHEIGFGTIAGVLSSGQRFNIWFENSDPSQMRFDYSLPSDVAVPSDAPCQQP